MTLLLRYIRNFLALLATRLYLTARNRSPLFALILVCPVAIRFLFQRGNLLKTKLMHLLKRRFQHCGSYIRNEKSKLSFKILKSVLMDDLSWHYRERANTVVYFCTENSRNGSEAIDESESNSDERSSHDESEDSVEKETKIYEIGTDDSVTCISSTKAVFESLYASQITQTQKRKAESEKSENPKRSKSRDCLKVGDASKQYENIIDANIKSPSETSSCYNNEETSSDPKFINVLDEPSKSDRIHVDELSKIESPSIEKSEDIRFPSQVSSPSRDKKPGFEDLHRNNSNDKGMKSVGRERFSSYDSALKNTVPFCQTERMATKLTQTETKKSYPNPKKLWKNLTQDEPCNTPSDPRMRENYTPISEYRLERSRRLRENQSFRVRQNSITWQEMASDSNTETSKDEKFSNCSRDSADNEMECTYIFPEINFSSILLTENSRQRRNSDPRCFEESENISEITRQFFHNFRNENREETVHTSNEDVSLAGPSFSRTFEENSERSDLNPTSLKGREVSSDFDPSSFTEESRESKENDISEVKIYPGLSLQPLDVKKDAMHQKRFYKGENKGIALPKNIGKVIQWAAKKPRDEFTTSTSNVLPSDENDLPTDEYHDQRQAVLQELMTIYNRAKNKKRRNKLDKKFRKEQKERMRRENNSYIEGSFKEESPSSESLSDSLPTSEDSPKQTPTSPVYSPKISDDYDISLVEVSPLKPVVKVSPWFSLQAESLCQAPPRTLNIRHLSDDENKCEEPSSESGNARDSSVKSVLIKFIDNGEVVNPNDAIFDRDVQWCHIQDVSKRNQRQVPQKLESFISIESEAPVSCTPISVEEFLYELRKTQAIYNRAYCNKETGVFEVYRDSMTICIIPMQSPQSPDDEIDYELDEEDEVTLVKRERHIEPEPNFDQFPSVSDHTLDVDKSEREIVETVSESRIGEKSGQKLREQVTSQAGNMLQSREILARDSTARTFSKANWILYEIDLDKKKAPTERSEEHSFQNIKTLSCSGSGQSTSPNRKTQFDSSIYHRSNFILVELKDPPQETQTTGDESNLLQKKATACARENLARKQSKTEIPTCCTEANFFEFSTDRKDSEPFESNPTIVSSGQQESPDGHSITAEEGSVNKDSGPSTSAVEKNIESIQQAYDIAVKLTSTPEKDNLSVIDILELSSDPDNKK